ILDKQVANNIVDSLSERFPQLIHIQYKDTPLTPIAPPNEEIPKPD
ncbi:unnamed protein product, partial [marine sediment metagenome]